MLPMLRGLMTTLKSMFEKPVTIQYPEVKRPVRNRFRGRHVLRRYENGLEKCIGCALCGFCEDACPTEAIVLEDNYELSFTDRAQAVYTKDLLLVSVPESGQLTPQKVEPGGFPRSVPVMKDPTD